MSEARVPGVKAGHMLITPTCKAARGPAGAFNEAARQLRETFLDVGAVPANRQARFHLVLTVERIEEPDNGKRGEVVHVPRLS